MSPLLFSPSAVLAALPEFPSVRESLGFQLTGLMVVFIALVLIWGLMELSGAIFRRLDASAKTRVPAPAPAAAPATPAAAPASVSASPEDGPDAATLAVIFAAVHTVLGGAAHRVVSVTPAAEAPLDWSREGRRDHFSSHRVR